MNEASFELASVYRIKPPNFSPTVEVSACYVESSGKFLFLKRAGHKSEGGKWGGACWKN